MFSKIRRRATYANVVMTLALVFAMSSGAYAAQRYLITLTKQISPKVIAALKGKAGKVGSTGPTGATGPAGAMGPAGAAGAVGPAGAAGKDGTNGTPGPKGEEGPQGEPWTPNGTLPKGATETGSWATSSSVEGETQWEQMSFPIALAKELGEMQVHIAPNPACPGTAKEPKANAGNLCVYTTVNTGENIELSTILSSGEEKPGAGTAGAILLAKHKSGSPGTATAFGTWAVTAE